VGEGLIFQPTRELGLGDPVELVVYAVLGLLAVGVALGFHHGERLAQEGAAWLRARVGRVVTLGVAGLAVGLIALVVPEVLGDGESVPPIVGVREPIQAILDVEFGTTWTAAAMLLLLLVAKLVATSITVGSGSAVGSFAPMLLTGAALGAVVGTAALPILPAIDPGAVATVGMAAVFGATARAPLTAIIIVFELVGDYELVLPLMLAVGLALFLHDRVRQEGIYAAGLRRRGVVLGRPDDVDVLQRVEVGEVMTRDHPTVAADADRASVEAMFVASSSRGYAVVDPRGQLVGVLTRGDLEHRTGRTAADLCTRRALTVTADDPVFVAVRRMASLDVGRVPVLDPSTRRIVGMLRREDIVRAYQLGLVRGAAVQQQQASSQLRDLTGVRFVELAVDERSPVAGRAVRDVSWPERTVLTSVRRGGDVVVPTGGTMLEAGDVLVVLAAAPDAVRALVAGSSLDR
jgi:chloride channel protein, CIC family